MGKKERKTSRWGHSPKWKKKKGPHLLSTAGKRATGAKEGRAKKGHREGNLDAT